MQRKGRSELLNQKRNELIVCRYYYHVKMLERPFEKSLTILEEEIHLSQRTLINILNASQELLYNLRSNKPDIKYFRNKYPHLVW